MVGIFSPAEADAIPAWLSPSMREALFLIVKEEDGKSRIIFGLEMNLTGDDGISLSDLEFIGRFIPPGEDELSLTVQLFLSTEPVSAVQVKAYNLVLTELGSSLPLPKAGLKKGLTLETEITAPLLGENLVIPITGPAGGDSPAQTKTDWRPLSPKKGGGKGRKLGPVIVRKVGLTMEDGKVKILLDAGLEMGGFTFDLLGFGIKIPLRTDLNILRDIDFGLDGMELDVKKGDITIAGGFMRQVIPIGGKDYDGYAGEIRVGIGPQSLTAFAGYVDLDGTPSFFIYAVALLPLGGVPEFFIDGFAGGFGLNSSLAIPPIEEVRNFIMVRAAFGESYLDAGDGRSTLSRIFEDIPPARGRHWIAVGIKATHYKFIESFLLVAVTFGNRVELELLGLARLKLPKGAEKLARAELAIHAHVVPEEGTIGIDARISDGSYILNPLAKLSGGFAFYTWFAGEHAGDFVITLGGYNPQYKRPAHFPSVPRLALAYQVSRNIYIKGSAYFALTPKMLMVGGRLEGTADLGIVRAWFVVQAHFLMNFQPFEYLITASVNIGATFRLKILFVSIKFSIQVGASMSIWGPEFGGRAVIDLSMISFTINFGNSPALPRPVGWENFRNELLPPTPQLHQVTISQGIVRELKAESFGPDSVRFIVNPADLEVRVKSSIPARDVELNYLSSHYTDRVSDWKLGIGPMNLKADRFQPTLMVTFRKVDDGGEYGEVIDGSGFGDTSVVPAALWGGFMDRNVNGPRLLGSAAAEAPFTGLHFQPAGDQTADVLPPMLVDLLIQSKPDRIEVKAPPPPFVPQRIILSDYLGKDQLAFIKTPDLNVHRQLLDIPGFEHLPPEGSLTFNRSTVSQIDIDQFDDPPLLGTLGSRYRRLVMPLPGELPEDWIDPRTS